MQRAATRFHLRLLLKSCISTLVLLASVFGVVTEARAGAVTVNIFGLENTALGSATLQVVSDKPFAGDRLVVSNIGPTGEDEVSVAIPSTTTKFESFVNNLTPSVTPVGSFIQLTSFGTVDGVSDQRVGLSRVDAGDDGVLNGTFDLSAVTDGPVVAHFSRNGEDLETLLLLSPRGDVFSVGGTSFFPFPFPFPNNMSSSRDCIDGDCIPDVDWTWIFPVDIFPVGSEFPLNVDAVRIVPLNFVPSSTFSGYSSTSLTAGGGISSFTIFDEQLQTASVPEPSSLFLLCSGLTGVAALIMRRYRRKTGDLKVAPALCDKGNSNKPIWKPGLPGFH